MHCLVFGILFAVLVSRPPLREYADGVGESTRLGLVYGFVIWIVAAGIVMPIWLQTVGFQGAPPLPNFDVLSLVTNSLHPDAYNRNLTP